MNIQFGNLFGPTKTFFEFLFMTQDMDHNKEKKTFKKNFWDFWAMTEIQKNVPLVPNWLPNWSFLPIPTGSSFY